MAMTGALIQSTAFHSAYVNGAIWNKACEKSVMNARLRRKGHTANVGT